MREQESSERYWFILREFLNHTLVGTFTLFMILVFTYLMRYVSNLLDVQGFARHLIDYSATFLITINVLLFVLTTIRVLWKIISTLTKGEISEER